MKKLLLIIVPIISSSVAYAEEAVSSESVITPEEIEKLNEILTVLPEQLMAALLVYMVFEVFLDMVK